MAKKRLPPRNFDFIQFGDTQSPGGALLAFRGREGAVKNWKRMFQLRLMHEYGMRSFTPLQDAVLDVLAEQHQRKWELEARALGVPTHVTELLRANSKSDQLRKLRDFRLTSSELFATIFNHNQIGFRYRKAEYEFIPEHLETNLEDRDAFFTSEVGPMGKEANRYYRKIKARFDERKWVIIHMFEPADPAMAGDWRCFYFTLKDMFGDRRKPDGQRFHWTGGPHVHYTSRAFIDKAADQVITEFETGDWNLASEHVAFDDK